MRIVLSTLALVLAFPLVAQAHKAWLLPSQTTFSGNDSLVTVDAAISNDLFYFNHHAMALDNLEVTSPDGKAVEAENKAKLRYRDQTVEVSLKNGEVRTLGPALK